MALSETLHDRLNVIIELLAQLDQQINATAQRPYARRIPQAQHDRNIELREQHRLLLREADGIRDRLAQINDPAAYAARMAQLAARRVLVDAERARIDARMAEIHAEREAERNPLVVPMNETRTRSRSRSRTRTRTRSRSGSRRRPQQGGGRKTIRRR